MGHDDLDDKDLDDEDLDDAAPPTPLVGTVTRRVDLAAYAGDRLDRALAAACADLSRARLQALIRAGQVSVAGSGPQSPIALTDPALKVAAARIVEVRVPPPSAIAAVAQDIPLDVVYEDADLIVVDKPAGLVVHPAAGNPDGTLVNALLHHCSGTLSGIGGTIRPGIVHRLDKDTSGLLVAAKNDAAHRHLAAQFKDHTIDRVYTALVWGRPRPSYGTVRGAIGRDPRHRQRMTIVQRGGKPAVTHYETIETFDVGERTPLALLACKLETGRTHQIRVHMSKIGHALVGDGLYGGQRRLRGDIDRGFRHGLAQFERQALHAGRLGFDHPTRGTWVSFEAPPPQDLIDLLDALRQGSEKKT